MSSSRSPRPEQIDSASDLVLLLLRANSEMRGKAALSGSTRLQKLLFLLTEAPQYGQLVDAHESPAIEFTPYKMGPFTADVFRAVDLLANFNPPLLLTTPATASTPDETELSRFVEDVDLDDAGGPTPRPATYALTPAGHTVASALWHDAPPSLRDAVISIVKTYGGLPIRELLQYVYSHYPQMTTRSEIKDSLGVS